MVAAQVAVDLQCWYTVKLKRTNIHGTFEA